MKEYKGITLIALIITVIVMLILAGVALSSISGEAGLFSRVQKTAELYNNSVDKEKDAINNIIEALNVDYNNDDYTKIYGVKRQINNASSAWTRIEDSVGLNANATHNGGEVENDFDNIYPWSEIKTCDLSADGTVNKYYYEDGFSYTDPVGYIMTEFPEFWWKREQKNDGYEYIYISGTEHEGFTKSEKFYLGRYTTSGTESAPTTKSGVGNLKSITFTEARTVAQSIGTNWGQLDIMRWSMLQMLYLVEYADYNSQEKLGAGNTNQTVGDNDKQVNSGACDELKMKSGCFVNDQKSSVIYRGVENIFGNITQWCDGIKIENGQIWVSKIPNDDNSYFQLGYTVPTDGGYIKSIGYDEKNPAIQLATENGGSYNTYITDYYYAHENDQDKYVRVGGNLDWGRYAGLFGYKTNNTSSTKGIWIGMRLLYIPS